jgi:hypothetical protein
MQPEESVAKALGRIAELLVAQNARLRLNEIQAALKTLASEAYDAGYDDAVRALDDRANEAAEREDHLRFQDSELGE